MFRSTWCLWWTLCNLLWVLLLVSTVRAEVTLDGSMGPAGALAGPDYVIPDSVGTSVGTNLFHSFGTFNVDTGESATFTGPATIDNVIGRVTGGGGSWIDGPLQSTIPGADLWLINPQGIVFGENARLDVQGSFHAATADYLTLGDSGRFDAANPGDTLLTTAPPTAFGFLAVNPAPITVSGSRLQVPEGETLSLAGGDLSLSSAEMSAPGGYLELQATGAGELSPAAGVPDLQGAPVTGRVVITGSLIDVSAEVGGAVLIRGGEVVLGQSQVSSDSTGGVAGQKGGGIVLEGGSISLWGLSLEETPVGGEPGIFTKSLGGASAGDVLIDTGYLEVRDGAVIGTVSYGAGTGGSVRVESDTLVLDGEGKPSTGIFTEGYGEGDGGDLTISTGYLEVRGAAGINATSLGAGSGGSLLVQADSVLLDGQGNSFTGIHAQAQGEGAGGDLTVSARSLEVQDGASISTGSFGAGSSGTLLVQARRVSLDGDGSNEVTGIGAQAQGEGDGGDLAVYTRSLKLRDGGSISAGSAGAGSAGNVLVQADRVLLDGDGSAAATGIGAQAQGEGDGGDLVIYARSVVIRDGGSISAGSFGPSSAGNVLVQADRVMLDGEGDPFTSIGAQTQGDGDGGDLAIYARSVVVRDGGSISASSFGAGSAGNILVQADSVLLDGQGNPGTGIGAQTGGQGDGGDLTVTTGSLEVRDGASISVGTFGAGAGGSLLVQADRVLLDGKGNPGFTGMDAQAIGDGGGGDLTVYAGYLEVRDGAEISITAFGAGASGNLLVLADTVLLDGQGSAKITGMDAQAQGEGDGGDLTVSAGSVEVRDGAVISTASFGKGAGGDILLEAESVLLSGSGNPRPTGIDAGAQNEGDAGDITIRLTGELQSDGGSISTSAARSDGGNIAIEVRDRVYLVDSEVSTSVRGGEGAGGNITIDPQFVVLNDSDITANAFGGPGGNISITAGNYFATPASRITASSALGIDGTVDINSPESDVAGGIALLPASFLDASSLLRTPCDARGKAQASRFVIWARSGVPPGPDGYLPVYGLEPAEAERAGPGDTSDASPPPVRGRTSSPFRTEGLGCEHKSGAYR